MNILKKKQKYRIEGRIKYYLDKFWVNAGNVPSKIWVDNDVKSSKDAFLQGPSTGAANPIGKGKRSIVVHIGSEDGFVPDGFLLFELKKNTSDYHNEMNGNTLFDWIENVNSLLQENFVIVMDN